MTLTRWLKSGRLSGQRRSRGRAGGPAAWQVAHSHIVRAAGEGWVIGPPPNERPSAPPTPPPPALIEKRGFRRWCWQPAKVGHLETREIRDLIEV